MSPPASPTLEVEQAAAELALQGAVGPELPSAGGHSKAGSCPTDCEVSGLAQETQHRKTSSLDSAIPIAPPPRQPCSSLGPVLNESRPLVCERYIIPVMKLRQTKEKIAHEYLLLLVRATASSSSKC